MPIDPPVPFSDDLETIKPDEHKTVSELNDTFDTILEKTAEDYGHAVRSVHAKAHGILEGSFTIKDGLPPELARACLPCPATTRSTCLFTNAGDILPDAISLPRGLALKVVGVEGERLPDASGDTQDFVLVNGPVFQAKTAEKFLGSLKMLAKTTDKMEGTKTVMSSVLQTVNTGLEVSI